MSDNDEYKTLPDKIKEILSEVEQAETPNEAALNGPFNDVQHVLLCLLLSHRINTIHWDLIRKAELILEQQETE